VCSTVSFIILYDFSIAVSMKFSFSDAMFLLNRKGVFCSMHVRCLFIHIVVLLTFVKDDDKNKLFKKISNCRPKRMRMYFFSVLEDYYNQSSIENVC